MPEIEIETTSSDNGAEQAPLRSLSRREPLVVPQMTKPRPRWTTWSALKQAR